MYNLTNGINVHLLKPNTNLFVKTKNSLYRLIKLKEKQHILFQGGKHFLEPEEVIFVGSTFGGSMLKLGWIGYGMQMEIHSCGHKYTTTSVRAARLVGRDWEYDMEWLDEEVPQPKISSWSIEED